ncbi:MAG: AbgT family transporter [Hyphomicrobiales bacterium]
MTPTDALLTEVTNDAIRTVNPNLQISLVGNLYFMIASSILMAIVCTIITDRFVEPPARPYKGETKLEAAQVGERAARPLASPGAPSSASCWWCWRSPRRPSRGGILRNQVDGGIMAGSPFMSGLIVLISSLFLVIGYAYGRGAGTIKDATAAIGLVTKTWSNLAGMIFLLFVIANFIAFFNWTNLATVMAVNLADFLQTTPIGTTGYIILFVIVGADRRHPHRRAGHKDPRAGVHPAVHAAGRRPQPGACRLLRRRQPDERGGRRSTFTSR